MRRKLNAYAVSGMLLSAVLLTGAGRTDKGERVWMDNSLTPCKKGKATLYMIVDEKNEDGLYPIELFTTTGVKKMVGTASSENGTGFEGNFIFYHDNGQVETYGTYIKNKKVGLWERFDRQGNPKAERFYESFDAKSMAYTFVDQMPIYRKGLASWNEFVKHNLTRYVSGTEDADKDALVSFIVTERGHIEDVEMLKGLSGSFDEQAKRAIESMPDWTPGMKQGKAVRVLMTMTIEL